MSSPFDFEKKVTCSRLVQRRGFTLVELLVVIAIIGVLVALLLPAVQAAREAARRSQCVNNLKQIGLALHNHHDAKKMFPPGYVFLDGAGGDNMATESTWILYILPYMEAGNIYDQADLTRGFGIGPDHVNNAVTMAKIPNLQCPSGNLDVEPWFQYLGRNSYVGNNGLGPLTESMSDHVNNRDFKRKGLFSLNSKNRFADMGDGSSNTAMVSEILMIPGNDQRGAMYPEGVVYHHTHTPNNSTPDEVRDTGCVSVVEAPCTGAFSSWNPRTLLVTPRSAHPGGVNILMGDGSVHFVSDTIALNVWQSAGTPKAIENEIPFPGF